MQIEPTVPGPAGLDPQAGIARLDLVRALNHLSPDDRALLALRYVAGYEAGELGELTGRSASATRTRLSRLTARLRTELEMTEFDTFDRDLAAALRDYAGRCR